MILTTRGYHTYSYGSSFWNHQLHCELILLPIYHSGAVVPIILMVFCTNGIAVIFPRISCLYLLLSANDATINGND